MINPIKKLLAHKKAVVAGVAIAVTLGMSGAAFAYFTSTGTGSGTGSVGNATTWNVNGGSVVGTLFPDASNTGPDQGVVTGASVQNNAASGYQNLNKIVATISGVTNPVSLGSEDACTVADFQFNSSTWSGSGTQTATILPNDDLAPSASYSITGLNVVMVDDGTAQDNCQGQNVTVTFNAS